MAKLRAELQRKEAALEEANAKLAAAEEKLAGINALAAYVQQQVTTWNKSTA